MLTLVELVETVKKREAVETETSLQRAQGTLLIFIGCACAPELSVLNHRCAGAPYRID